MLIQEFRDALLKFNFEGVEFLLVGAYALATYGLPRATGDIDFWIRPSRDNSQRVWNALARFGAPMASVAAADFEQKGLIFQIGVAPRRIDVITEIDGVTFDEAWDRRREVIVDGIKIFVISKTDLMRNKAAAGRPKDLADIAWLQANEDSQT